MTPASANTNYFIKGYMTTCACTNNTYIYKAFKTFKVNSLFETFKIFNISLSYK